VRPALIIDGWAIFDDGRCRKLSLVERYLWWRGRLKTIKVKGAKHETL
jgi:hypothetical protein